MATPTATTMPTLAGKVAIVTGASSGIGLAACTSLLSCGAFVLGVDMSPAPPSLSAQTTSKTFCFHQCNLTSVTAAAQIVEACKRAFGARIDVLFNVAGIMDTHNSADTVEDDVWDRVLAVNLTAPVKLMRAVLPVMKAQGSGSVVNVSSKAGTSGAVAGVAYTASKHGLIGATKNVAWRFHDDGIRCNAICPGGVLTNIQTSADFTKMDMLAWSKIKPVVDTHLDNGEMPLQGGDIVGLLLFLASDMSRGITGAIIPVDKGFSVI